VSAAAFVTLRVLIEHAPRRAAPRRVLTASRPPTRSPVAPSPPPPLAGQPPSLNVSRLTASSAIFTVTPPLGGCTPVSYRVSHAPVNSLAAPSVATVAAGAHIASRAGNLKEGQTYEATAVGICADGTRTPPSAPVRFTPRVSAPAGPPPDPNCAACSAAAVPAGMTIPNPNPDSNDKGANFAYSVSVDGCYAVFGAVYAVVPELAGSDNAVGEVFVFSAASGSWVYEQRLIPEAGDNFGGCDYFGSSVAVSACTHTIVVGTQGEGTATIFRKPSDKWTRTQFIEFDSTRAKTGGFAADSNVAFDGTALAIGASKANSYCGAVYTYALNAASDVWDLQQVFDPVSIGSTCEASQFTGREFGSSVAMTNSTMVVGAPGEPYLTTSAGAAYVLTKNSSGLWSPSQELYPTLSTSKDYYGRRVAISRTGDTIMVGGGNESQPFIGAWAWNSTAWAAQTFTGGNDFFPGFGSDSAIVVDGDVAFVGNQFYSGAPLPTNYTGLVGVFKRDAGGVWNNTSVWMPADVGDAGGNEIKKFGYAMRLSKANAAGFNTLVVGAGGSIINGADSGVGYLKSVNLASL
jgi:hypothetical protein